MQVDEKAATASSSYQDRKVAFLRYRMQAKVRQEPGALCPRARSGFIASKVPAASVKELDAEPHSAILSTEEPHSAQFAPYGSSFLTSLPSYPNKNMRWTEECYAIVRSGGPCQSNSKVNALPFS